MATIHPQLVSDSLLLGKFTLCHLLLMRDANYPWCILVPDRDDLTEIYQLSEIDQQQLLQESSQLSRAMVSVFNPDKLNIAALGNVVPQLHIHHIVRYRTDAAWPAPVWGRVAVKPYQSDEISAVIKLLLPELKNDFTRAAGKKMATQGRRKL